MDAWAHRQLTSWLVDAADTCTHQQITTKED
jgi:hypothetical protein